MSSNAPDPSAPTETNGDCGLKLLFALLPRLYQPAYNRFGA